jgi:predicted hydrocarbon binding protein
MKHSHKWIKSLLTALETELDEKTRAKILENCGRNCITQSFILRAKACKKDAKNQKEFLDKLGKVWKSLRLEGDNVYVVYEKCYCQIVKEYPEKLSPTWCNCSQGWIKELFESSLGKPVEVKLEKSIKQGDNICKFRVQL